MGEWSILRAVDRHTTDLSSIPFDLAAAARILNPLATQPGFHNDLLNSINMLRQKLNSEQMSHYQGDYQECLRQARDFVLSNLGTLEELGCPKITKR